MIEENGWEILNGNMEGDEEGQFTFIGGKGNTVIDYVLVDTSIKEAMKNFKIEERVESDHLPMKVEIYENTRRGNGKEEQWKEKSDWSEDGIRYYQEEVEKKFFEGREPNELMEEMTRKIREAIRKKVTKIEGMKMGWKKQWDKECTERKREARKALRRWKQGKRDKETYIEKRRVYKKMCEEKRREQQQKMEEEIEQLKNKNDIWKYINRERKRKVGITNKISVDEWRNFFMEQLEGQKHKVVERWMKQEGEEWQEGEEETITEQEVNKQIKKLKTRKAAGDDGLENEVWMYGGRKIVTVNNTDK